MLATTAGDWQLLGGVRMADLLADYLQATEKHLALRRPMLYFQKQMISSFQELSNHEAWKNGTFSGQEEWVIVFPHQHNSLLHHH